MGDVDIEIQSKDGRKRFFADCDDEWKDFTAKMTSFTQSL